MSRLRRCTVENVGLIARAELDLAAGLTVVTGETGSGKTMLLGALKLVLGERASPESVARDAATARVTLELEPDGPLRARFADDGFDLAADEDAIFVREVQRSGKSSARVNGRPATAAQLRGYGETLVDFVGQHEQQRLLSTTYQTDLLDRFAGEEALALRDRVRETHARLRALDERLQELRERSGRALAEAEFARFAAAEIADANPSPGEDESVRERHALLSNAERIAAAMREGRDALTGREASAAEGLGAASATLAGVAPFAQSLTELAERAAALQSDATDLAFALSRELERLEFDPAEHEALGARLDVLERLKKKYGGTLEAVLETQSGFSATAAAFEARDELVLALHKERDDAAARLRDDAERLGEVRAKAGAVLEERVAAELSDLAMKHARLRVVLEPNAEIGPRGAQRASFAFAANRGEEARPLARTASGGELSRVLLALIVVLAGTGDGAALVFDEIDAGIGGATAGAVAMRLAALAHGAQVLCVTHLAQIASWADLHVALRKRETSGATHIGAQVLGRDETLEELARMLSGSTQRAALDHAEALLEDVRARRRPARRVTRAQ